MGEDNTYNHHHEFREKECNIEQERV